MMWQLRGYSVPMSPWIPHLGLEVSQAASAPPPPPASSATSSGPPGLSAKAPAPRLPFLAQVQSDIKAWFCFFLVLTLVPVNSELTLRGH